jgi:hypothetical protein
LSCLRLPWPRCTSMLSQSCAVAHSFLPIVARLARPTTSCLKTLRFSSMSFQQDNTGEYP